MIQKDISMLDKKKIGELNGAITRLSTIQSRIILVSEKDKDTIKAYFKELRTLLQTALSTLDSLLNNLE